MPKNKVLKPKKTVTKVKPRLKEEKKKQVKQTSKCKKSEISHGTTGTLEKLECFQVCEKNYSDPISCIPKPTLMEAGIILNKFPYVSKPPDDSDRPLIYVAENRLGLVV